MPHHHILSTVSLSIHNCCSFFNKTNRKLSSTASRRKSTRRKAAAAWLSIRRTVSTPTSTPSTAGTMATTPSPSGGIWRATDTLRLCTGPCLVSLVTYKVLRPGTSSSWHWGKFIAVAVTIGSFVVCLS